MRKKYEKNVIEASIIIGFSFAHSVCEPDDGVVQIRDTTNRSTGMQQGWWSSEVYKGFTAVENGFSSFGTAGNSNRFALCAALKGP